MTEVAPLADRLALLDERVAAAARTAGRDPAEITRIVVTKFHPAQLVRDLHALGVRDVGENRQQEISAKRAELEDLADMRWHFVGQIQTNKARAVRAAASVVHSVDRTKLADALSGAADAGTPPLDVLVQINLTADAGRGGTNESDVVALAEHVAGCAGLRLRGVMAVAPLDENPAAAFARLAEHAARVRAVVPDASWISAGMTGDFEEAIAVGATHLRIGSAITGNRPARG
ncbi:MAG: YggS family pyridoxal phosphate-dependent enzyme [Microbacterium sp.]|uniref:YggS family pyridoxal phosphate-dependent enzyme n=1 Tax=Microbacterium sp. TaxID=51671 RepID=UPI00271BA86A|nr:YggS family pyridoxal phosphate-dependent enzyme [Microbacterium sp.]MDO8384089.1 YggS family pyridoxal phosphate-dependent enzyme [Microbacterium sp.]